MALPRHPSLSEAANEALARGEYCTPRMKAFALNIPPGDWRPYDQIGNFAYFARASGSLEIAFDNSTDFMPWDVAMAINSGRNFFFRRISVRNPGDTILTGLLYMGEADIRDHRQHQLGEQRVTFGTQIVKGFESTLTLANADWVTLAASTPARREIWLSVERTDGGTGDVKAYWRVNSLDAAKVPVREIGLALDGITRLPFSDRIDVSTDAAFAGIARIRYWIVTHITLDPGTETAPPDANERLVIPPTKSPADVAGIAYSNYDAMNIWKLFDSDPATAARVNAWTYDHWGIPLNFGETIDLSRVELDWCAGDDALNAPAVIQIYKSIDGNAWERVIGPEGGSMTANCQKPSAPGQVIFSRSFAPDELKTRYLNIVVVRTFAVIEGHRPYNRCASYAALGGIRVYTRQP